MGVSGSCLTCRSLIKDKNEYDTFLKKYHYCPVCGKEYPNSGNWNIHTSFTPSRPKPEYTRPWQRAEKQAKKREQLSKKFIWIIGICISLLIIVLIFYVLLFALA